MSFINDNFMLKTEAARKCSMERDKASSYFLCLHGREIVLQGCLAVEEGRMETVPLFPRQDCAGRLLAWMLLCRALGVGS